MSYSTAFYVFTDPGAYLLHLSALFVLVYERYIFFFTLALIITNEYITLLHNQHNKMHTSIKTYTVKMCTRLIFFLILEILFLVQQFRLFSCKHVNS